MLEGVVIFLPISLYNLIFFLPDTDFAIVYWSSTVSSNEPSVYTATSSLTSSCLFPSAANHSDGDDDDDPSLALLELESPLAR